MAYTLPGTVPSLDSDNVAMLEASDDPLLPSFTEVCGTKGEHATVGLILEATPCCCLRLVDCAAGTPPACITRWRSCLWHAFFLLVNGVSVLTCKAVCLEIAKARSASDSSVHLWLAHIDVKNSLLSSGVPLIHHD